VPKKIQTSFKNSHKASYLARDIAQHFNRGQAIEAKIETVLNQFREITDARTLKDLDTQKVEAFIANLQDRVETGDLSRHTAESYVSALNRIIEYTIEHLGKDLQTVSPSEVGLSRGSFEYTDRSVSESTHNAFISFLQEKVDIRSQALQHSVILQREFGLRLRESIGIKQETIKEALQTGVLSLDRNDCTKNGRPRDIPIIHESQREALQNALYFQKENGIQSLAPTETLREQYSFAKNMASEFNQKHDQYFVFHGERHAYAQKRLSEGATREEVAKELGHNREEVTKVYGGFTVKNSS
jgi:site-specific recombinase XerD